MFKNLVVLMNDKEPIKRTYMATNIKEAKAILTWLTNNDIKAELHDLETFQAKFR